MNIFNIEQNLLSIFQELEEIQAMFGKEAGE